MQLNEREAYNAMVCFLEDYYRRTKSDDVGSLLGDMMKTPDGGTADPAVWSDWLRAIETGKDHSHFLNLK